MKSPNRTQLDEYLAAAHKQREAEIAEQLRREQSERQAATQSWIAIGSMLLFVAVVVCVWCYRMWNQ